MEDVKRLIKKIEQNGNLSRGEAYSFLSALNDDACDDEQLKQAVLAYVEKTPTVDELLGFLDYMRSKSLNISVGDEAVDNCGTGGSGMQRINTSTLAAFIAAACDVKIAKHGNKASGGRCGSFDVLQAAEVNINLTPEQSKKAYEKLGLAFLFAPLFHPAMRRVAQIRKEIAKPTIFNLLGPLSSPAGVKKQVIGVSKQEYIPLIIDALKVLEIERALIVRGDYGLDEITVTGASQIYELQNGKVNEYTVHPRDFGVEPCKMAYIKGGDTEYNRRVFFSVLENKDREYRTEQVLFNAAAVIYVAGKADTLVQGYKKAKEALTSKKALQKFLEYRDFSQQF